MSITLRKLLPEDEESLMTLANNRKIADDMCTLPFPFSRSDAESLVKRSTSTEELVYGIEENSSGEIAGVIIIREIEACNEQAELSLWIGEPFWGKGIGTEALKKMVEEGYSRLALNRLYAFCMVRNVASQRILEKAGFQREGLLRECVKKNGMYEDVYIYARVKRLEEGVGD